ncbi:MAG: hypothetical protein DWQ02_12565, partial [Bacteroidetes bacterium]
MKNLIHSFTLLVFLISTTFLTAQGTYNPNQIIIDFAEGVTPAEIDEYLDLIDGTIIDQIDDDIYLIEIASFPIQYTDVNGQEVVFYNVVDIIENDVVNSEIDDTNLNYDITSTPLDFEVLVESLPGETYTPIPDYVNDYPGLLSCNYFPQNQIVKIGIIDTGIDYDHTFITNYVAFEANVINGELLPIDDNGHGTQIAGIIAALAESSGISPDNLELYIIKAFDSNGQGNLFDMQKAIRIANELELDVLNLSWGFSYPVWIVEPLLNVIPINPVSILKEEFNSFPGIIVCGAGNDGNELLNYMHQGNHYGPADFELQDPRKLLTVAGLNSNSDIASFWNYNHEIVD